MQYQGNISRHKQNTSSTSGTDPAFFALWGICLTPVRHVWRQTSLWSSEGNAATSLSAVSRQAFPRRKSSGARRQAQGVRRITGNASAHHRGHGAHGASPSSPGHDSSPSSMGDATSTGQTHCTRLKKWSLQASEIKSMNQVPELGWQYQKGKKDKWSYRESGATSQASAHGSTVVPHSCGDRGTSYPQSVRSSGNNWQHAAPSVWFCSCLALCPGAHSLLLLLRLRLRLLLLA